MPGRQNLNPERRPQRLYQRRELTAMPKARVALQSTAWKILGAAEKQTIVTAVRNELNRIMYVYI